MREDRPLEFRDFPDAIAAPFGPFRAVVERIVDGDTLYVLIDAGWNTYRYTAVRLLDINAPELFHGDAAERAAGAAAKAFLAELIPPGTPLLLETQKDPDSFGRYVCRATMADGRVVNDVLVAAGHAVIKHY